MRITDGRAARRWTAVLAATSLLLLGVAGGVVASDRFSDVPAGHAFHDDIGWLADRDITEGYPDDTFRPTTSVTRQAMAAFLRRVAGQDPDVAPVVDAATLDGASRGDLQPRAWGQRDAQWDGVQEGDVATVELNDLEVEVPEDGLLLVSGGVLVNNQEDERVDFALTPLLDGTTTEDGGMAAFHSAAPDGETGETGHLSYTVPVPVTAGTHTLSQRLRTWPGQEVDLFYNAETLSVQFLPGAASSYTTGAVPSGGTGSATGE